MINQTWDEVDLYLTELVVKPDSVLEAALTNSREAGLPMHNVSAPQGKLLYLLARIGRAERILEIGTLGGYSTIWLARALPAGGRLITLEVNPLHADVASANLANAELGSAVDLRVGPASDALSDLVKEGAGPFDLIFIDADKAGYPEYLEWALKLSRPGTVIIGDNVVRDGGVIDDSGADPSISGVRRFLDVVAEDPCLSATAIQTVGSKGYDGFVVAVVGEIE